MQGLTNKYTVTNNETGREVVGAFILKPDTDLAARAALLSYAAHVAYDNPQLAELGIPLKYSIEETTEEA